MAILEDIRDIFSIFHDGGVEAWEGDNNLMKLTVGCTYLAELIHKDFNDFYIELEQIDRLEYDPWWHDIKRQKELLTDPTKFFSGNNTILQGDIKDRYVEIVMLEHDTDLDWSGGHLYLSCAAIRVYDESMRLMTIDELDEVCRRYWDKFGKGE